MVAGRRGSLWPDALIRGAGERFRFLVEEHGFRQVDDVDEWRAHVEFRGERLTLSLTHGNRECDYLAELKYARFPRKNPRPLWAILEALGVSRGPVAMETGVDEDRLRILVAETADLVSVHWEILDCDPTRGLYLEIEKILDRYARRVRKS